MKLINDKVFNINYYYLVIFFIFFSCTERDKESLSTIDIASNLSNYKDVKLSQLASEISYIPLQTDSNNLLGNILSIKFNERNILITDKKKCLEFDQHGYFKNQIGKNGKGPGEYLYALAVNSFGEHIFISDLDNISVYDNLGKFLFKIKVSVASAASFNPNWIPLSDSTIICHVRNRTGNEKYCAIVVDLKSDTIAEFQNHLMFKRERLGSSSSDDAVAQFYYLKKKLSFKELFNDTLYRITNLNKMEPAFVFNLGKYKFPNEYRGLAKDNSRKISSYIRLDGFFESKNLIIMDLWLGDYYDLKTRKAYNINGTISYGIASVLAIYEKESSETYFVSPSTIDDKVNPNGIENDLDGGMNFFPDEKINDSTLLMVIQPFELKTYIATDEFKNSTPKHPEKKKQLEQLANSLDENDNPVLMLVKLKE